MDSVVFKTTAFNRSASPPYKACKVYRAFYGCVNGLPDAFCYKVKRFIMRFWDRAKVHLIGG